MTRILSMVLLLTAALFTGCCGMQSCNSGCPLNGLGSRLACAGGCGEVYVGEYINHPPVVDPCGGCDGGCDSCGGCNGYSDQYSGYNCQPGRPALQWLSRLWGVPYNAVNCGNCGAQSCLNCQNTCRNCQPGSNYSTGYGNHSWESNTYETTSQPSQTYEGSLQPVPQKSAPTPKQVQPQPETIEPQVEPQVEKTTSKVSRLAPAQQKRMTSRLVTQ